MRTFDEYDTYQSGRNFMNHNTKISQFPMLSLIKLVDTNTMINEIFSYPSTNFHKLCVMGYEDVLNWYLITFKIY